MITKRELKRMGADIPDSEIIEEYQQDIEDYEEQIAGLQSRCIELKKSRTDVLDQFNDAKALCDIAATQLCEYDSKTGKEILGELEDI